MMNQNPIQTIEERVRRDGSLSEERKNELLNMLLRKIPEMVKLYDTQDEYAASMVRLNDNEDGAWKTSK